MKKCLFLALLYRFLLIVFFDHQNSYQLSYLSSRSEWIIENVFFLFLNQNMLWVLKRDDSFEPLKLMFKLIMVLRSKPHRHAF